MNILEELNAILPGLGLAVETGTFTGKAPDEYMVITSVSDDFPIHGDNLPVIEVQEVRISLYSKQNYVKRKRAIVKALLLEGFTITAQTYLGREDDTGYFHVSIDVQKSYPFDL